MSLRDEAYARASRTYGNYVGVVLAAARPELDLPAAWHALPLHGAALLATWFRDAAIDAHNTYVATFDKSSDAWSRGEPIDEIQIGEAPSSWIGARRIMTGPEQARAARSTIFLKNRGGGGDYGTSWGLDWTGPKRTIDVSSSGDATDYQLEGTSRAVSLGAKYVGVMLQRQAATASDPHPKSFWWQAAFNSKQAMLDWFAEIVGSPTLYEYLAIYDKDDPRWSSSGAPIAERATTVTVSGEPDGSNVLHAFAAELRDDLQMAGRETVLSIAALGLERFSLINAALIAAGERPIETITRRRAADDELADPTVTVTAENIGQLAARIDRALAGATRVGGRGGGHAGGGGAGARGLARDGGYAVESTYDDGGDAPLEDLTMSNSRDPWRAMQSSPPAWAAVTPVAGGGHHGGGGWHGGGGRRRFGGWGGWGGWDWGYPYWYDYPYDVNVYVVSEDQLPAVQAQQQDAASTRPPAIGALAPIVAPASTGIALCLSIDPDRQLHAKICVDGRCYESACDLGPVIAHLEHKLRAWHEHEHMRMGPSGAPALPPDFDRPPVISGLFDDFGALFGGIEHAAESGLGHLFGGADARRPRRVESERSHWRHHPRVRAAQPGARQWGAPPMVMGDVDPAVARAIEDGAIALVGNMLAQHEAITIGDFFGDIGNAITGVVNTIGNTLKPFEGVIETAAGIGATAIGGPAAGAAATALIKGSLANAGPHKEAAKQHVTAVANAAKTDPHAAAALDTAQKVAAQTMSAYHVVDQVKKAASGDSSAHAGLNAMFAQASKGDPAAQWMADVARKSTDVAAANDGFSPGTWHDAAAAVPADLAAANASAVSRTSTPEQDRAAIEMDLPDVQNPDNPSLEVAGAVPVILAVAAALGGYAWWRHYHAKKLADQAMATAAAADAAAHPAEKAALADQAMGLASQAAATSPPATPGEAPPAEHWYMPPGMPTASSGAEPTAIGELRKRSIAAAKTSGEGVVGVICDLDGCHAYGFGTSDDADDWFGKAIADPSVFLYAAYFDKSDPTWPTPLNEAMGRQSRRAA